MAHILVNVNLYGSIAKRAGGKHIAQLNVHIHSGAYISDLLAQLGIPEEERGYLFQNAVLCEVPGLSSGQGEPLKDGDHIGIFSIDYMWPYQYRDGVPMSDSLKQALAVRGAMHHTYQEDQAAR